MSGDGQITEEDAAVDLAILVALHGAAPGGDVVAADHGPGGRARLSALLDAGAVTGRLGEAALAEAALSSRTRRQMDQPLVNTPNVTWLDRAELALANRDAGRGGGGECAQTREAILSIPR